jgi:hypothetical protein
MRPIIRSLALLVALAAWSVSAHQETAEVYQGAKAEHFLAKAKATVVDPLGTGITEPKKVTLVLDGVTHYGVFKDINERKFGATSLADGSIDVGYQDSWETEIAAYHVDRIIGLGLVPATVQRNVKGKTGSLQWWVEHKMTEAKRSVDKVTPPDPEAWNRLVLKVRLFDELIANVDRHAKNLLVTENFELRLIDHSRSFRETRQLRQPKELTRFSQSLLDGITRLNKKELRKRIKYLSPGQIDRLLLRRDAILALAKKLVAEKGEAAVIYP